MAGWISRPLYTPGARPAQSNLSGGRGSLGQAHSLDNGRMRRFVGNTALALTMIFIASCRQGSETLPADRAAADRLSTDAFGPIRVGMSVAEARRAAGVELTGNLSSPRCAMLYLATDPAVQLMIENDLVTRIDVTDGRHPTVLGVRVGDTEARAQATYGGMLQITPHKYDQHGHYLTLRSPDKKSAMVFETDGERITRIRAGVIPSVEYVERCG